jgi:hypothetical protein
MSSDGVREGSATAKSFTSLGEVTVEVERAGCETETELKDALTLSI